MKKLTILKDDHPALRIPSAPITEITPYIKELATNLAFTMAANEGVGISAVQVAQHIQMLIIDTRNNNDNGKFFVMLNPEILHEEGRAVAKEGCLSFPKKYRNLERSKRVVIKYLTLGGTYSIVDLDNQEARIFLHEYDHLQGKLFID